MLRAIIEKITGEPVNRPLRLIATACAVGVVVYVALALALTL